MIQLHIEKKKQGEIPYYVVHPLHPHHEAIVFYHGWSSRASNQITRAAWLALSGYTVYIPEALHHGERGMLDDYFEGRIYPLFWNTIFQNMQEFKSLGERIKCDGFPLPIIMGHSMGGFSALGIAGEYGNRVKGVISMNGSGDWLLSHLFMQARFGMDAGRDWPLYDKVATASPISREEIIKKVPILLLNGESDITVDPRAQAHFYEVISQKSKNIKKITYPRLGHFVTTNMMEDALRWIDELCLPDNKE